MMVLMIDEGLDHENYVSDDNDGDYVIYDDNDGDQV